jgi:hypothetical protein
VILRSKLPALLEKDIPAYIQNHLKRHPSRRYEISPFLSIEELSGVTNELISHASCVFLGEKKDGKTVFSIVRSEDVMTLIREAKARSGILSFAFYKGGVTFSFDKSDDGSFDVLNMVGIGLMLEYCDELTLRLEGIIINTV